MKVLKSRGEGRLIYIEATALSAMLHLPKTGDLKQVLGAGKLVTQVLDPLSKTLGPDILGNSENVQTLESLHGAYIIDDATPLPPPAGSNRHPVVGHVNSSQQSLNHTRERRKKSLATWHWVSTGFAANDFWCPRYEGNLISKHFWISELQLIPLLVSKLLGFSK